MDPEASREITKFIWSLGNYSEIAKQTLPPALDLVNAVGITDGQAVLDVATGSGNVAVLAAQRGARVSACDITPAMVELARSRAAHEGLEIDVKEGNAEELPYPDDSFDVVLSVFGAMFAPNVEATAAELFRATKPGGTVGMANWTPEGVVGRQTRLLTSYAPGGPPDPDPLIWGTEDGVAQRLGPHAESIEIARLFTRSEYESWDETVAHYENNLGPAIALKQLLEPEVYGKMMGELEELYAAQNQATDETIVVDSEYLRVIARKPG